MSGQKSLHYSGITPRLVSPLEDASLPELFQLGLVSPTTDSDYLLWLSLRRMLLDQPVRSTDSRSEHWLNHYLLAHFARDEY